MTRDGEIPAIFNPKRVRTPSVVVTGDSPNSPFGGFTTNPDSAHNGSSCTINDVTVNNNNQPDSCENIIISGGGGGGVGSGSYTNAVVICSQNSNNVNQVENDTGTPTATTEVPPISIHRRRLKACENSCCSELAQKMYFGVCVTILVTASWVGATHCIKFLYLNRSTYTTSIAEESAYDGNYANSVNPIYGPLTSAETISNTNNNNNNNNNKNNQNSIINSNSKNATGNNIMSSSNSDSGDSIISTTYPSVTDDEETIKIQTEITMFNAPFFASWFFTNFAFLFFPIYLLGRVALRKCDKPKEILVDVLRGFRDRGFTIGRFLNRCMCFCFLWVITTYLYTLSLRALLATDVMALFATNVGCVYLLSWVILHEQFVGVRIVAVILCDTGIALLAYMDGITGSPTLGGVVLAALAAAGYAVFKVMFRKVMGDPPVGQIAFAFTTLGFLNIALLWPVCVGLYLTGTEVMPSDHLPWFILLIASILLLVFHILTQFSAAVTYNMFVTLGLITSVPVSAALDVLLYEANFAGMKLAGVILIGVGFFLVMFPENWPDYITRLLRNIGRAILTQCCCEFDDIQFDKSKYHLVGSQREMGSRSPRRLSYRSTSSGHRLSDGLYTFPSPLTLRSCEMTDQQQQQQQQQQSQQQQNNTSPEHEFISIKRKRKNSYIPGIPSTSTGNTGGGHFLSYFGNTNDNSTKKKETPIINFGFRRKSSVFYAATD